MRESRIALIVGSLRRDSFNQQMATALTRLGPPGFTFKQVQIGDLPLYNQDDDANQSPPVLQLKSDIAVAQGLIFLTPEYNRSIPGVLKNAIDHASRPYGKSAWAGKPAGVMGVSVGAIGTSMAQGDSQEFTATKSTEDSLTLIGCLLFAMLFLLANGAGAFNWDARNQRPILPG